jgi:transcriptional regulator with XRE-family HTH domain
MAEVMTGYKIELLKRGKKLKDLVRELQMSYSQVSRIMNGFDNPPAAFDRRVKDVLKHWDFEIQIKK